MSVKEELNEQKFEAMLKPALYEYMLKELEKEEQNIPDTKHQFSKSFERKMNRLMRKIDAQENRHKKVKIAAAAILAAVVATGVLTMNVEALRVPIQNFFMGKEYSVIDFGGRKDAVEVPVEYEAYVPEYVPEGYQLVYTYGDDEKCCLQYSNIDGQRYDITIYVKETRTAFDTESGEVSKIVIGNYEVVKVEKDGRIWMEFISGKVVYVIEGNIELIELEKVLDSI